MARGSEATQGQRGFVVAVRRFPHDEFAIRRLLAHSETFRDICAELAEAELALSNVPASPRSLFLTRHAEWQDLVDRLVTEIDTAIRESQAWHNSRTP